LTLVAFVNADVFSTIRAVTQGDNIVITWRTQAEPGVQNFEIERKSDEVTEYRRLGRVIAHGSAATYSFTDDGAFYKNLAGKRFTYRIRAVGPSVDQYSSTATVVHEVSGVRRSWGMIKELFR
jgi:hypothetical protein